MEHPASQSNNEKQKQARCWVCSDAVTVFFLDHSVGKAVCMDCQPHCVTAVNELSKENIFPCARQVEA